MRGIIWYMYQRPTVHERICKMCNSGAVEDEVHFILDCSLYDDLRDEIFNHLRPVLTDFDDYDKLHKFYDIMQCNDYSVINKISKMYTRRTLFS